MRLLKLPDDILDLMLKARTFLLPSACAVQDENNVTIKWGQIPYQDMFGPDGWCNSDMSTFRCPCRIDGFVGEWCNIRVEMNCANQCT